MNRLASIVLTLPLVSACLGQTGFKVEYQDVCGHPAMESQIFPDRRGVVTKIIDGDSVEIKDVYGKLWSVDLAGVRIPATDEDAKGFLKRSIWKKKVIFTGNPDKEKTPLIEALVRRKDKDINRHLITNGLAKFKDTDYDYAVSDYKLCVLEKLEQEAKIRKIGIWASR